MNYLISKHSSKIVYNYYPQTRAELKKLIKKLIKERSNTANLNDIDTSSITNMSFIFYNSNFDGDISNWDISNVKDMSGMFAGSRFTGKNGDISNWDISNVKDMSYIFAGSLLETNPPSWFKIK